MAAVEEQLDRFQPMFFFAGRDVVFCVDQVVDDRGRIGPHAEEVVALEKAVVAVGRVRDHQGLHRHRVFFHQVADARVAVDDDLVGQPHVAAFVVFLGGDELLAVAPMAVVHRHAHARVGIHHLLGGDDLELVRVGVEPKPRCGGLDRAVVLLDQLKAPVARPRQRLAGALGQRQRLFKRQGSRLEWTHDGSRIGRCTKWSPRNRLCRAAGGAPLRGSAEGATGVVLFMRLWRFPF
jgi:hypothetical protein